MEDDCFANLSSRPAIQNRGIRNATRGPTLAGQSSFPFGSISRGERVKRHGSAPSSHQSGSHVANCRARSSTSSVYLCRRASSSALTAAHDFRRCILVLFGLASRHLVLSPFQSHSSEARLNGSWTIIPLRVRCCTVDHCGGGG